MRMCIHMTRQAGRRQPHHRAEYSLELSSPSGGYAGVVLNYAWAADGHLANYSMYSDANSATTSYSAHWDGDTLLYVAFGGVMALYVEKLGFSENAGNGVWQTVVYDRDQTGTSVDTHFSVSTSFYGFTALNWRTCSHISRRPPVRVEKWRHRVLGATNQGPTS